MSSNNALALIRKHVHPSTPKLPPGHARKIVELINVDMRLAACDVIADLCRRLEEGEKRGSFRVVTHDETLMYYDGVQIFEGFDRIGGRYVGSAVDDDADGNIVYLLVGVSPELLANFRAGQQDLLSLIHACDDGRWFVGKLVLDDSDTLTVSGCETTAPIPADYLPGPGLTLTPPSQVRNTAPLPQPQPRPTDSDPQSPTPAP